MFVCNATTDIGDSQAFLCSEFTLPAATEIAIFKLRFDFMTVSLIFGSATGGEPAQRVAPGSSRAHVQRNAALWPQFKALSCRALSFPRKRKSTRSQSTLYGFPLSRE